MDMHNPAHPGQVIRELCLKYSAICGSLADAPAKIKIGKQFAKRALVLA